MIQNHLIEEKLEKKVEGNTKLKAFIYALIEKELSGGQHKKLYQRLIEDFTKEV